MLQIKNIFKKYKTGDLIQVALNDVSLNLRDNEFVAILGPSGSGKTTLLNIIGGLDRYDKGDLIINNVSTKKYKDRDWDAYRNHTIGFVFQSYNLIPHQTVLKNVELALTISGVGARERKQRALQALDEVGLKDQAHKKPNQMSGGQMQRVAIARALVNNPDILLADEPTGALDTKTSIQVMDLLKKVANDRLVVMVTHNPELANEYANRIVRLQDGQIISDTNPFNVETKLEKPKHARLGKARMGFFTALSLSFNNLLTKKGRTILTAFAGSIGIIGIALILSLSQGFQNYIDKIQEDTLSSYPLTITSDTADMTSAILSMVTDRKENKVEGENVYERQYLTTMFSSIGTNDLRSFKEYLENNEDKYSDDVTQIKYSYSISPNIYSIDAADKLTKLYPSSMWNMLYSNSASSFMNSFSSASGGMIFSEMTDDVETIYEQYDVLKGRWPSNFDEVIIVLSEPNSISDLLVYSLGLRDTSELKTIVTGIMSQEEVEVENDPMTFTYDDLMNIDLRLIKATDTYKYNSKYDIYEDMSSDEEFMNKAYDNALKLKVVGIVCPSEESESQALAPGVSFQSSLTQYVIDEAKKTSIVQKQLTNKDIDVFSGKSFDEANEDTKKDSELNFEDMISVDEDMIKDAFKFNLDTSALENTDYTSIIMNSSESVKKSIVDVASQFSSVITTTDKAIADGAIQGYISQFKKVTNFNVDGCTNGAFVDENDHSKGCKFENPDDKGVEYDEIITVDGPRQYSLIDGYTADVCVSFAQTIDLPIIGSVDTISTFENGIKMAGTFTSASETLKSNGIQVEEENIEKVVYEIFEGYFNLVRNSSDFDLSTNLIKIEDLTNIDYSSVVNSVLESEVNASMIYGDAFNSADQFITLLVAKGLGETTAEIMSPVQEMFEKMGDESGESIMEVDTDKFAQAFKFDMNEDELSRLMETMLSGTEEKSYKSNLISLGFQDVDDPTSISLFFKNFESKENFLAFLDDYNNSVDDEEKEISYTDITGILMSSVKTIVDSVTYVLIAFVSISLVVSSIMIAVITLISVMERTKEIGILRAMGASKHNVSSIFNAETFIIGLLSGLLGVGVTYASIPPINALIHSVTDNNDINAVLPTNYAIILVGISVVLTIIAGVIPSRKASKQDPVIALRTE